MSSQALGFRPLRIGVGRSLSSHLRLNRRLASSGTHDVADQGADLDATASQLLNRRQRTTTTSGVVYQTQVTKIRRLAAKMNDRKVRTIKVERNRRTGLVSDHSRSTVFEAWCLTP